MKNDRDSRTRPSFSRALMVAGLALRRIGFFEAG
jgi:hypothetical protein